MMSAGSVDLSVVVPLYNAEGTIAAQLESLCHQHGDLSLEIVVADNASTDGGRAVAMAWAEREPRVRVVDARRARGPSHARNVGGAAARGALLAFCDADDVVAPQWAAALAAALVGAPAASGPLELVELNPAWLRETYGTKLATEAQTFAGIFPFGATANLAVRREVFDELGGFDETIEVGEDIEFCLRLWERGHELRFVPDAVVHYRLRTSLGELWRQSRRYGVGSARIAQRVRAGGHSGVRRVGGLRSWIWLVRYLPRVRDRAGRARWTVVAGTALGRLAGSLRYRTLYL